MVTKVLLVLLLLGGLPVAATAQTDDVVWVEYSDTTPLWSPAPRDTTRYYIIEIKQKCDTCFVKVTCPNPYIMGRCLALHYQKKIECVDDTVWAEKVQVWLTPEQLKILMGKIKEREQWELDINIGRWSPVKE